MELKSPEGRFFLKFGLYIAHKVVLFFNPTNYFLFTTQNLWKFNLEFLIKWKVPISILTLASLGTSELSINDN